MRADLRANVVVSAAAMVLTGAIRPGFNAVVSHAFGPEVNGRAGALIALVFLASLPATAALPTVLARQVSRAVGRQDMEEGRAHARFSLWTGLWLTAVGAVFCVAYGRLHISPPFDRTELAIGILALFGYAYWRLARTLLLVVGKAMASLRAELFSVIAMFLGLGMLVLFEQPKLAATAFALVYLSYAVVTLVPMRVELAGGKLDGPARAEAVRYNLLWFVGSATSLAAREIVLLLLDARVERALVGEVSLALSFLMMLALAPRIIELPLVHELSALGGEDAVARQRALTEKGIHWLTLLSLAAGFGMAILAGPILAIAGAVRTPVVIQGFALVCLAFMSEMMLTPANNLLVAEAPPSVFSTFGVLSLLAAFAWWWSPWGNGVLGVCQGLALSYAVKAIGVGSYTKLRFGVRIFERPLQKSLAIVCGLAALWLVLVTGANPWLIALGFELLCLVVFMPDLLAIRKALIG